MFHLEDVLQLKDTETVKLIVRRHSITLFPGLFLSVILIVIPFFLMWWLFAWGVGGMVIFLAAVIIGIVVAIRTFLLWDADVLVVTTLRLVDVDQKGMFTRIVSETPITAIQDVSWSRKGLGETIFRMGTVVIKSTSGATGIEVRKISFPEQIYEFINDLRHSTTPKRVDIDPVRQEKLKGITALLEGFSMEELERIESILKARDRAAATDAFLAADAPPTP